LGPFTVEQWDMLSGPLALSHATGLKHRQMVDTSTLLDRTVCRAVLDELGPIIGSPSRAITASLLGKRIAFLVVSPSLYAMSMFDQGLNMRMENCITDYTHLDGAWRSRMVVNDLTTHGPGRADRFAWIEQVATGIFAGHLAPLWEAFHQASGIAPRILWENTAVRVYSLYERRIAKLGCGAQQRLAQDDFRYLTGDAPPSVFGLSDNPLARYFFERKCVTTPGGLPSQVRVRKTCCLYFMATKPPEYCSTCPLL